jgi:hypothetical protein
MSNEDHWKSLKSGERDKNIETYRDSLEHAIGPSGSLSHPILTKWYFVRFWSHFEKMIEDTNSCCEHGRMVFQSPIFGAFQTVTLFLVVASTKTAPV